MKTDDDAPAGEQSRQAQGTWLRRGALDTLRGAAMVGPALAGAVLATLMVAALTLLGVGVGLLLVPAAAVAVRRIAGIDRRLAREWSGVQIAQPYQAQPQFDDGLRGRWQHCQWIVTDPATWRDLAWMLVDAVVGVVLAVAALSVVAYGAFGLIMPILWEPIADAGGNTWYMMVHVTDATRALVAAGLGVLAIAAGLAVAPRLLHLHAALARTLLAPTAAAEVRRLTETRTDALNTQARELRRIERDLHDGAQARLVAMGMSLGVAENLVERDPQMARTILAEARASSASALNELRDLVRGIHPPVLADRGLVDAVRALALDSPVEVDVTADLAGRLELPVESAVYFAVSEALTNVAKHARADRVAVELRHADGWLRTSVTDDGQGGADAAQGTGLHGMQRRLATFDGVVDVASPRGGPTTVTMELPCALSSPKTSSS